MTLVVDMKISHRILYQTSLNFLLRNIIINFQNIKSILKMPALRNFDAAVSSPSLINLTAIHDILDEIMATVR